MFILIISVYGGRQYFEIIGSLGADTCLDERVVVFWWCALLIVGGG